jgi:hypothetical protein
MKILRTLLAFIVLVTISLSGKAQTFRFGFNGNNYSVFGDMASTDLNNKSAGFVEYAQGGSFDFVYLAKNNLGMGIRMNYTVFSKDNDKYRDAIRDKLGVTDDNYIMQNAFMFFNTGFQFGFTYNFKIKGKFSIEPYLYFGLDVLMFPQEEVIFSKAKTTYTYRKYAKAFPGFSYSPGVRFQWNLTKHFGLNLSAEYYGAGYGEDVTENVLYNDNVFEPEHVNRNYGISALNIGFGVNFFFGEGTKE